jgi:GT2 family glycosyltransferase
VAGVNAFSSDHGAARSHAPEPSFHSDAPLHSDAPSLRAGGARPSVHGRSLLVGGEKLHVRGVTYGTFASAGGSSFPAPDAVRRDLEAMAAAGVNALRTYVPPPLWLLDAAGELGLRVMVGLAWEQHVAFLQDAQRASSIVAEVGRQVQVCRAHPAVLCYALGNEIPAGIVRWHGKREVERFLRALYWEGKAHDPDGLFTYVNYPSTEYLELPFLDLAAFNVFLEEEAKFESYLARLQNVCGDRPLLVTEVGLDSARNGTHAQARALGWQVRHSFATGSAGVFVFSWTDEWHRGGHEVTDWDFGLVDRERRPKPALAAVSEAFAAAPFSPAGPWPRISVVVCTHNGARTLPECLERVNALSYPDFETIVVCDGSTDGSALIAREHGVEVIETDHLGLSSARNAGIARASGEIVAFLDDDAYPDTDWLHYIAAGFSDPRHAGVGGPNIPPEQDGVVADCVALAPGGPIHVLVSDREAEHVPGCNMAFRRSALQAIGGFDERFRTAGDDVDVCWRLQKAGHVLGFSAGAVVIHRRRESIRRYLRQQYGYGRAEALLERKWPGNYNRAGASRWEGRIYEQPPGGAARRRPLVRYGVWGTGLFQSIYDPPPSALSTLLRTPESLLLLVLFAALAPLGLLWQPLLLALPAFGVVLGWLAASAIASGWRANPHAPGRPPLRTLERRAITALLFFLQPFARLAGRLRGGLSPWRRRLRPRAAWPHPRTVEVWSERWREPQARIQQLEDALAARGGYVRSGGPFDRWDLALRAGPTGGVKIRVAVEEHGQGRQLLRARVWPAASSVSILTALLLAALAAFAWHQARADFGLALGLATLLLLGLGLEGTITAAGLATGEIARLEEAPEESRAREARGEEVDDPRSEAGEPLSQVAGPRSPRPPAPSPPAQTPALRSTRQRPSHPRQRELRR